MVMKVFSSIVLMMIQSMMGAASPSNSLQQIVKIQGVYCTLLVSSVDTSKGRSANPLNLIDDDLSTYWRPAWNDTAPIVEFRFEHPIQIIQFGISPGLRKRLIDLMDFSPPVSVSLDGEGIAFCPGVQRLTYTSLWQSWDSLHPFKWDGANGALREMWIDQSPQKGRAFRLVIRNSHPHSKKAIEPNELAISEVLFLGPGQKTNLIVPPVFFLEPGQVRLDLFKKTGVRIQNFHRLVFWRKNELSEFGLEGDPPLPPKPIYFIKGNSRGSSDLQLFLNLLQRSQVEQNGFWFRPGSDGQWTATFPPVSWGIQEFGVESHPVIEGNGAEIVSLISTDGVLPQDPPQIHYLNTRRQIMKIKEPAHKPDTSSVRVGNQVWMKHNLSKSKRDSGSICWGLSVEDSGKWNRNCAEFGRLYRAEDALHICPEGWHIPSVSEWKELFDFVDSSTNRMYSQRQLWFFLMAEGKWHFGEPGMDPFQFSAKYYTRPAIGPRLESNRSPTFLTAEKEGCLVFSATEEEDCNQVIDFEFFPISHASIPSRSSLHRVKMDYAPARCIRDRGK